MPLFRKPVPQDPLVVSMTGTRLGHRVAIVPSAAHDDVVLAVAAKVGLTGQVVAVAADEGRRAEVAGRALRAGVLVDTEPSVDSLPGEPPFDVAILDARTGGAPLDPPTLASLYARLRPGGRLTVLRSARAGGLSALLGAGGEAPDTSAETTALLAAGFRTARVLAVRERTVFIEAIKR